MATRTVVKETEAQMWTRMAELACERGIAVWSFQLDADDDVMFFASSHTNPDRFHVVTFDSCDCEGFGRCGHCTHIAALRVELGMISPAPAVHVAREDALAAILSGGELRFHAGTIVDISGGDYPTEGEYRGMVALAKKRGVVIEGLDTNRPVAVESRGRYDLSIETCTCPLFVQIGCCQHLALLIDILADRADAVVLAA